MAHGHPPLRTGKMDQRIKELEDALEEERRRRGGTSPIRSNVLV